MRSSCKKDSSIRIFFAFLLLSMAFVAAGCGGEESSEALGGDRDYEENAGDNTSGDDRCADVGNEACPTATDCMSFSAVQTAFPECAIYCKVNIINEGISCRVLDEYGVCSNGRCVIPGQMTDGDVDADACRPEYAEVPVCPKDSDCAEYEHMWQPMPDCRWLCVALPINDGRACEIGGFGGYCASAQCVPVENGDAESLLDGDIDDIENEYEIESSDGELGEDEFEQDENEEDSATGETEGEMSESPLDGDVYGSGGGGGEKTTYLN